VLELRGAVAVVTGGASGIGRALVERLSSSGARVAVADLRPADGPGELSLALDVGDAGAVAKLVATVEAELGPIDLYCSNAGVAVGDGLGSDPDWARSWSVHAMAHVHAARAVLPGMRERRRGHFVVTASAAGLLMMMQSAPYTVTKHASVAIAEWLAVTYGTDGVSVHCLAPQGVRTPMVAGGGEAGLRELEAAGTLLEPAVVAEAVLDAVASGQFLITPHPEVRAYEAAKVADRDRWLARMRRLREQVASPAP
jgi:NAD(P)-dependent dehydrogenase (short-subunit alcohol dehydrogenase family)